MDKKLSLGISAALLLSAPLATAMSDAEIEKRFQMYEERIKVLETELNSLKSSGKSPLVNKLQKQISKNKKRADKKLTKLSKKLSNVSERMKINGFMTAAVSMADDDLGTSYNFTDKPNFKGDSKVGLQLDYKVGESTKATIQLLARSRSAESWQVDAEWAYLSHDFSDSTTARMGRLRIPFYLYSETIDVGYSYPWVRPPTEMYTTAITSYDGADVRYRFNTGDWNNDIQFFGGGFGETDSTSTNLVDLTDLWGTVVTGNYGDFTLRGMATHISIRDAGVNAVSVDDDFSYYSVGAEWNSQDWLVITEGAYFKAENGILFPDFANHYITAGKRIGNGMPFMTYAASYSHHEPDFPVYYGILNPTQSHFAGKSVSLGFRQEVTSSVAMTVQWDHFFEFADSGGSFDFGGIGQSAPSELGNKTNIYTLSFDTVF